MRIAMINVVASLSTGRIANTLCEMAMERGHHPLLCFSRDYPSGKIPSYRIGSKADTMTHVLLARLTDRSGFFSKRATNKLVRQLRLFKPDLVHLHNIHGYYLHIPTLFAYLKEAKVPVLWTLHDCWAFTGHCAYYTTAKDAPRSESQRGEEAGVGCERWLTGCGRCPLIHNYPESWVIDQSRRNWSEKRACFTSLDRLILITPSDWLKGEVERSFLNKYPVYALPNGLDLRAFIPCRDEDYMHEIMRFYHMDALLAGNESRTMILSVAAVWEERKGLEDLIDLAIALGRRYCVVAVGLDKNQIQSLPANTVVGLPRTNNLKDLCALYTAAGLYVSLSHEETMGMSLVEALACGTQVLCYNAAAMPEIVTPAVGETVPLGDIAAAAEAVRQMCSHPRDPAACRARAEEYDARDRFSAYLRLYEKMVRY